MKLVHPDKVCLRIRILLFIPLSSYWHKLMMIFLREELQTPGSEGGSASGQTGTRLTVTWPHFSNNHNHNSHPTRWQPGVWSHFKESNNKKNKKRKSDAAAADGWFTAFLTEFVRQLSRNVSRVEVCWSMCISVGSSLPGGLFTNKFLRTRLWPLTARCESPDPTGLDPRWPRKVPGSH